MPESSNSLSSPSNRPLPFRRSHILRLELLLPVIVSLTLTFILLVHADLAFAQTTSIVSITKSFSGGQTLIAVESGAPFTYEIAFSCAAITPGANCDNAVIIDDLPPEVEYVSTAPFPGANIVYEAGPHRITVTFPDGIGPGIDGLNDGDTGILTFRVRFPPGTLGSVTADNDVTIDADNSTPATSETITAQTLPGTFEMTVQKSHVDTTEAGVIDMPPSLVFQTVYNISVCGPDDIGGVNLSNTVITDTLPAEATFVSAADGGVYDSGTHSVVWMPGLVTVGGCFSTTMSVGFDPDGPDGVDSSGDEPVAGNTVVNNLQVTGDPEDGSPSVTLIGSHSLVLSQPSYDASLSKSSSSPSSYTGRPTEELAGGPVIYDIAVDNTGTVTLTNVIVTDTVPISHTVTSIEVSPAVDPVSAYYQASDNPGAWIPFPANPYVATTSISIASLALNPGAYVTAVRWEFGDIPVGASGGAAGFTATLDPTLNPGTTLENCANMGLMALNAGTGLYESHATQSCASVSIIERRAIPRPVKTGNGDYFPEEIIDYNLRLINADVAHNNVAAPFILADVLPAQLEVVVFDPGSPGADDRGYRLATPADDWFTFTAVTNTLPAPAPTSTLQTNYSGNDTLVSWEWDAPYTLAPGEQLIVDFQVRVKRGTPPQTVNNRAVVLWDGATVNPLTCPSGDGQLLYIDGLDVDGDGNTTETGCQTSDRAVNVRAFLKMESEKWVMGARDGGLWNKDGLTVPGGDVDYRIVITNASNVTATNLVVYDILPYIGDTGVVNTIPRLSEWRPNMQGLDNPDGLPLTVYYSQEQNPCRPELISNGPPGCIDDWSTTPPTDYTSIQAIKLEFCAAGNCLELTPDTGTGNGGVLEFAWDMVAPNDAPADPSRAWNSFGFSATDVGSTLNLLPAEPNKVGIRVEYDSTGVSLGNYVWLDVAGQQDDGIQQLEELGVNGVRVELWDPGVDGISNTNDDMPVDLDSTSGVDFRITGLDGSGNEGYYLFHDLPDSGTYSLRFFPPIGYTASPENTTSDDLDSDGEFVGSDPTYGTYLQTVPITFTTVMTEDLTWDQGIWLPTDYGDAPNIGYPVEATTQAPPALAARHVISAGLHLGTIVDAELDGQPDANALGDDVVDDEDGISFDQYVGTAAQPSGIMTIGAINDVTATAVVPTGETAYLNAWIDFNGDGDWDDSNEQIALNRPATGGDINLTVAVPAGATAGTTYARFRLSTELGLTPYFTAMDGEVEDYEVQLISTPAKYVAATSETHTSARDLAIGEIVRYRLEVPVAEGTLPNFVITDSLPSGLQFVDVDQVTVTYTTTTSITHDPINVAGGPFGDGTDPIFDLGTVVNNDNDAGEEWIIVEFNALVLNVIGNQAGNSLPNSFDVSYDTFAATSNVVNVNLVEPVLNIGKSIEQPFPTGPGTTITYTVVIQHEDNSDQDAFDLVMTDTLPIEFDPTTINVISVTSVGTAAPSTEVSGGVLYVPATTDTGTLDLPNGAYVTIVFTADLAASYVPGPQIHNKAGLIWTTINGPNGNERDGGSPLPDGVDLLDSGALDDYEVADTIGFNLVDFGDLPNPYPTTAADNGGLHFLDEATYLGAGVDADIDGQPSNGADGDDNDAGGDDEDGVTFSDPLKPGTAITITVNASTAGYLNAWFDWDNNGNLLGAGEQIFTDEPLAAGDNALTVNVPVGISPASLYARFRFTSGTNQATSPTGQAPNGEIEDYVLLSLGDTIWFDNGADSGTVNDGIMNGGEAGISDVDVELYRATQTPGSDMPIVTDTTDINGNYFFYGIAPGDYIVHIPDAEFGVGATLEGLASSSGVGNANADNDQDVDENGVDEPNPPANGVSSASTTLTPGAELQENGNSNPTIDFGFVEVDWGDLPEATLLVDDGARHLLDGQTFLGTGVDADVDGQPQAAALGDDSDVSDDEDGVVFLNPLVPGRAADLQVTAGSAGFLNAWIDFNGNGLIEAGEQIATDLPLVPGVNTLNVTVPADGTSIDTVYSRFRFSANAGESTTFMGLAPNGEVEDYALVSIGNRVWLDENADGVQNAGENGLDGVLTNLLDGTGAAVTDANGTAITTTTSAGGYYTFGGLNEGNYIVEVAAENWNAGNIFGIGGAYEGALGSPGQGGDDQTNTDDNGDNDGTAAIGNGIQSVAIDLTLGGEPSSEDAQETTANANSDLTIDFGVYTPVNIGDLVWLDADADGTQDAGELGIANATVSLLDASMNQVWDIYGNLVVAQTTGADGLYSFPDLVPGDYVVRVTPPANHYLTSGGADPDNNDNTDSNGYNNAGAIESLPVTLSSQAEPATDGDGTDGNLTVDFGFFQPVNLGNYVWFDVNADGVQDVGENGLVGATVELFSSNLNPVDDVNGAPVISQTTSADGFYNFVDLVPGDYIVQVTPPTGYFLTTGGADPDDDNDSDSNGYNNAGNIQSLAVSLKSMGEPDAPADGDDTNGNLTVDFGFFQPVSVGNYIWLDTNANGTQDGGESGLAGVQVQLLDTAFNPVDDASGTSVDAQTTFADGLYSFSNLVPGHYVVQIAPPAGYGLTAGGADPDDNDNTDSNGYDNAGVLQSQPVTLVSQDEPDTPLDGDDTNGNMTVDFGLVEFDRGDLPDGYATLATNNGARHVLDGITYLGASVDADTDGQPNTAATGDDEDGSDDENGITFLTPLAPGRAARIRVNAGVTGFLNAWIDYDGNGSFDAGEQIAADTTLAAGDNDLTIAVPGTATALNTIYSRFRFTSYDPDGVLGPNGQANDGEVEDYALVSIGNRVWLDENADGVQNAGENGLDGVLTNLLDGTRAAVTDANGTAITTTTSAGGYYTFGGLNEGNYIVEVAAENWNAGNIFGIGGAYEGALGSPGQGGDDQTNTDDNGDNDGTAAIGNGIQSVAIDLTLGGEPSSEDAQETTANANSDLTIDFGVYTPVNLGNYVWFDANDNGTQDDGGGAGLAGAIVELFFGDGVTPAADINGVQVISQTTGGDGLYNFTNLPPGNYVVQVTPPVNFGPTIGGNDPDDDVDTDSNGIDIGSAVVQSPPVTLASGQEPDTPQDNDGMNGNLTVDFGFTAIRDWGDLPEGTYPTTAANNGARHIIDGVTFLGADVDAESDGQPNTNADGDDVAGNDDEDGVSFGGALLPGAAVKITVTASVPGFLNAWFDWDNDGTLDVSDQVFAEQALVAGENALVVNVPGGVDTSTLYARFRFTAASGDAIAPTGLALTGEVEDYEIGIGRDWGDLPDIAEGTSPGDYNTIESNSGPSHALDGVTYLGSCVDTEADGQPTALADGDDSSPGEVSGVCTTPGDDEDGIVFVTPLIPGRVACVDVTSSAAATLNGWIDFNGNGDLTDPGEQVFNDVAMSAGLNSAVAIDIDEVTCFNVPATAPAITNDHAIYARFRYTANPGEGGDSPTGPASNGEVEDYAQPLLCLGDLVWHDADDNGTVNGAEYGINGINLDLYYDFDGDGLFEPGGDDVLVDSTVTAQVDGIDGSYSFCGLSTGGYFVQIPNTEFETVDLLYLFGSSTANADPDVIPAVDNDDNGDDISDAAVNGIVSSGVLNLAVGAEPTTNDGDTNDQGNSDANTNMALDLGVYRTVPMDYGDLPASYDMTEFANDGPRHTDDGLRLGALWDADNDGQESTAAVGDDSVGSDDEDGVTIPSLGDPKWDGVTADLDVKVSGDGCLNIWIDFGNGGIGDSLPDGDFDDAGEHVLINELVSSTTITVTIDIPDWAFDPAYNGQRSPYLRARLTPRDGDNGCVAAEAYVDGGGASPQGLASGGEVEDYAMNFSPTVIRLRSISINSVKMPEHIMVGLTAIVFCLVAITALLLLRHAREKIR